MEKMAAVHPRRSGNKVYVGLKRKREIQSPLDKAQGHEVIWLQVNEMFEATRGGHSFSYVYFIGEVDSGPVKIGVAKDPITRLRGIQTGNPRRLCIEFVLVGDLDTERLLHEMWESYAIPSPVYRKRGPGTEWFRPEIREDLYPIVIMAMTNQVKAIQSNAEVSVEEMEHCIREAHLAHDFIVRGRDEDRYLGSGAGYVGPRKSRI